ncbi:2-hydroxyacid dehydrogenase [Microvirga sp. STR05]|uniref:2-hydroxyacid dehydrogenase n=1 Tax=Hymenobacter duratus TaxID=2771356 RepID=A0ABR8JJI5_9BACT|nr:2-hydroxyacid dehydrogenase [Hymenobacter duratus]MBD2715540.1 2-hydroxyacid dehydrogenase [Hymenobacter duratus]MBR7950448.1 2-hydroxyacid dehydrogenase [Microvirga sp. STR05]
MHVTVYSARNYEWPFLQQAAAFKHTLHLRAEPLSLNSADRARGSEAVAIFANDDASAPVLAHLAELGVRYVAVRGAGYDQVDVAAAHRLGLRVANVPDYSPYAVAEHAVALMLALSRQLWRSQQQMRRHDFRLDHLVGFNLHGKTVGIVGCGRIGGALASILHGFGCQLLGHDVDPNPELSTRYGLRYLPLPELCAEADIISLHAPLTPATHYLFGAALLAHCKPGAVLINTGRGGLLDTQAALAALRSGRLGYLGLDVYEYEKGIFFENHAPEPLKDALLAELLVQSNVLVTGHQAFLTREALTTIATGTTSSLDAWEQGRAADHEITLSALASPQAHSPTSAVVAAPQAPL